MSAIHVLAYLLVPAVSLCLAWGIRGQTGHEWGAAYCGAVVGLALALVSRDQAKVKKAFTLAALGGFGFAWGGMMSYGELAGTATNPQADAAQIAENLTRAFAIGAIWGGLGGGVLGVVCSRRNYGLGGALLLPAVCWLAGKITYGVLVGGLHLDLSRRPNSDWALLLGAWLALLAFCRRDRTVPAMSLLGGAGIGLGFVVGPMLTRIGLYPSVQHLQLRLDWWKVAEHTIGFCGGLGLGFALWLLERRGHQAFLPQRVHPIRPFLAQVAALWFIPGWNLHNVFEYWSVERGLVPTGAWTLFLAAGAAVLLTATAIWLCRLYASAPRPSRMDETTAAALGFFLLVWSGVFIAGLKMEWPYQHGELSLGNLGTPQLGFTLMALLLTAYLALRAPEQPED